MNAPDASAIEVEVLLFGPLADVAATPRVRWSIAAGARVGDLLDRVAERWPALRPRLASVAVAVNLAYATRGAVLSAGDEVALIPPVSGG
jgi:molybdopterin synthase catalytic subunit